MSTNRKTDQRPAKSNGSKRGLHVKTGKSKEQHHLALVQYLSNPSNPYLVREDLAKTVCSITPRCLHYHFSPKELAAIELEALELRRQCYAPKLALVDQSVLKEGANGSKPHAQLAYERFEGWSPKHQVNVQGAILNLTMDLGDGKPVELNAPPEAIEGVVEGEDA